MYFLYQHLVMLSAAKHLGLLLMRPFAEFILSGAEGLRVTTTCGKAILLPALGYPIIHIA